MTKHTTDPRDIEEFAQGLGKMLGSATAKAERLVGHGAIAADLEGVLERATQLLDRLATDAGAQTGTAGAKRRHARSAKRQRAGGTRATRR